ncbi:hybrid sensor histidine kinase/response regulator transcription factor [Aquimarina sp. 2304DJ70-9]|uniref:hybrid sensor histidine kinase/response regulator transcription factor n=1 Tax=Aquimarina penaris TaxID=3231044 RepID=UPI003461D8C1
MKYYTLIFFVLISLFLHAQKINQEFDLNEERQVGVPPIQNYSSQDYIAGSQNFAVTKSNNGLMYFGNSNGLLEYDGVSWRIFRMQNTGAVRALAKTENNEIYVGGYNELGYLKSDTKGQLQFVSLKKYLDIDDQDFQSVINISILDGTIFFQCKEKLLLWKNNKFRVISTKTKFNLSKVINNELYIVESNWVIKKWVNDTFETLTSVSHLIDKQITDLLPYKTDELLVLSQYKGLFILKENNLYPFGGSVDKYLKENVGIKGIKLNNGLYSFATRTGGIIVMDNYGRVIQVLDKSDGLLDNTIHAQLEGQKGSLWLAANNGISRVELLSPYSIYDNRHGLDGFVNRIYRHKGQLYVANYNGVFFLEKNTKKKKNVFKPIRGINSQAFYFLPLGDTLIAASRNGVDFIVDHKVVKRFDYLGSALLRSKLDNHRIYLGLNNGLASIKYEDGKWKDDGRINGIKGDIRKIVEDDNGDLWLESQDDGFLKVDMSMAHSNKNFHNPVVKLFTTNKELPKGIWFLHEVRGEPLFSIGRKPYKYDSLIDSIIPNPALGRLFGLKRQISVKKEDEKGNIWMWAQLGDDEFRSRVVAIKQHDDSYIIKKIHDEHTPKPLGISLLPEDNGIVWYGGNAGIVRHDINSDNYYKKDFNSHIRRITTNKDSLIFGGTKVAGSDVFLPFRSNQFRIEFSATSFDDESKNMYQFYLDGFDKDWSQWTHETKKDYTNIPEGNYTFKVRAKNIYGHLGKEDSYYFTILPPWYRTWWAYLLYVIGAIVFVSMVVKWYSSKLQKEKEKLETTIKERTQEIIEKNKQLEIQATKLKEMDKVKSRFFANISHEFRTPITLIKGPIKEFIDSNSDRLDLSKLTIVERSADRLLELVNQLLDLSKLDAGNLKLETEEADLNHFLRSLGSAFNSYADQRNISYTVAISQNALITSFDKDKVEKIVSNLLSNAFKYTPDNGEVKFSCSNENNKIKIIVSDTGIGISKEKLPYIFDRFYQVDASETRDQEGTGIGLALVKELVKLNKGIIHVASATKQGTAFTVLLPLPYIKEGIENLDHDTIGSTTESIKTLLEHNDDQSFVKDAPIILVVEDNNDMRKYIIDYLKSEFRILEAADGRIGLEISQNEVPDLIISDVMMPKLDGISMCKQLKEDERTSHIPIVMLTAKAEQQDKLLGLDIGVDDYLVKPFDNNELKARVNNLIEQRNQLRKLYSRQVTLEPKQVIIKPKEEVFLEKVIECIELNLSDDGFGVPQMQEMLLLSKTQLHRKMKALTDMAPGEFLRNYRLKIAAQLICKNKDSISQIAYSVGFNSVSYFTRCFKSLFGATPTEFVKEQSQKE